jgi:hypothetical protein
MEYNSLIQIKNSSQKAKKLVLEPWAEGFEMVSGKHFLSLQKPHKKAVLKLSLAKTK